MTSAGAAPTSRWTRPLGPRPDGEVRLFCFHHAGGSAAAFLPWTDLVDPRIELVAVQLPGRSERFAEKPIDDMDSLVGHLLDAMAPQLDRPYAMFGYSMGARVSLALTQALQAAGGPGPQLVMVGASPAPKLRSAVAGWDRSDAELVNYLFGLGGMPPEIKDHPDLLELMLPTVRADLTAVATWPYQQGRRIGCPIAAFSGRADRYASPSLMRGWATETASTFTLDEFDGDHFFVVPRVREVVAAVNQRLLAAPERGTTSTQRS
jgi:medium-chain acyl-[acyl-carrier-protein] hydrolase